MYKKIKEIPVEHGICLILYSIFILIKALYGYLTWGPLAFRHAALFYYPFFAVFSYFFYSSKFFDVKRKVLIISIILLMFVFWSFRSDWVYGFLCISLVMARSFSNKWMKGIFIALILILMPYKYLFNTSRMGMLSNFASIIFVVSVLCFFVLQNRKNWVKVAIIVIISIFVVLGFYRMVNKDKFLSIFNVAQMRQMIASYDNRLKEGLGEFTHRKLNVELYNENLSGYFAGDKLLDEERKDLKARAERKKAQNKAVLQKKEIFK
ncbi:hypothetical protein KAH94_06045, partial [bacterium]|nr:hypothetical protein [bacterium]